jgi:hypothetical protein
MSIYIDINGSWGAADELVIINDETWEAAEYDEMSTWTDLMLVRFSEEHNGMKPSEWVEQHDTKGDK